MGITLILGTRRYLKKPIKRKSITKRGIKMSEKEDETFGHEVTLIMARGFVLACLLTYAFNLFEPYLASACDTSQVPIDHVQP